MFVSKTRLTYELAELSCRINNMQYQLDKLSRESNNETTRKDVRDLKEKVRKLENPIKFKIGDTVEWDGGFGIVCKVYPAGGCSVRNYNSYLVLIDNKRSVEFEEQRLTIKK